LIFSVRALGQLRHDLSATSPTSTATLMAMQRSPAEP
jgi:hypothetical protein